jgi:hypothetical protein
MNRRPGREGQLFLAALPFALVVVAYLAASGARLALNADDAPALALHLRRGDAGDGSRA